MRNYQYTPEEEAQMDAFANEWKKNNRGIKGPSAWREFKQKHPWAKKITADALRQKYTRMKRDQYWKAYAITHANCPPGHVTCTANPPYSAGGIDSLISSINSYVSSSTTSIPPSSPLPSTGPSAAASSSSSTSSVSSTSSAKSPSAGCKSVNDGCGITVTCVELDSPLSSSSPTKENKKPASSADAKPEDKQVSASSTPGKDVSSTTDQAKEKAKMLIKSIIDEWKKDNKTETPKPGQVIEKSEAEILFDRIMGLVNGQLVPTFKDSVLVLVPANASSSSIQPLPASEFLVQLKKFQEKLIRPDSAGQFQDLLVQLMVILGEFEKLKSSN